jgi:hypothetical protein
VLTELPLRDALVFSVRIHYIVRAGFDLGEMRDEGVDALR